MALARSTARRYAEAAFEIAERDDSMEAWLAAFAEGLGLIALVVALALVFVG